MAKLENTVMVALTLRKLMSIIVEEVDLDNDNIEIVNLGNNTYKILINVDDEERKKHIK